MLLFTVAALILLGKSILADSAEVMRFFFRRCTEAQVDSPAFAAAFFRYLLKMILPVAAAGITAALAGNLIQNRGMIFSFKPVTPDFTKIIPKFGQYFKNTLFSAKGLFNVAKSVGKVAVIVAAAYFLFFSDIFAVMREFAPNQEGGAAARQSAASSAVAGGAERTAAGKSGARPGFIPDFLMTIQNGDVKGAVGKVAGMAAKLLVTAAVIFLVIAVPDYFVNRREFMESMKMTKYEQKQEYKELEGDPEVKSRLQQAQRRLLQQNMPKAVRESDVVITNPTHFAVAMKYDRAVADSPKVTAKGADEVAFTMRRIARENNVPVVENRPLARGLYTDTEVGDIIPDKYLAVLANVYAEIMKYDSKEK